MDSNLKEKLQKIKAVVFDSVGVIFSEAVYFHKEEGEVIRLRSHADGQGITLLRGAGFKVSMITSETSGFLEKLGEKFNNLSAVKNGQIEQMQIFTGEEGKNKIITIENWLAKLNLSLEECAYMGDDIGDYEIMKKVGVAVSPDNAQNFIKDISHIVVENRGGDGAVRDFCNILFEAQGIDVYSLPVK